MHTGDEMDKMLPNALIYLHVPPTATAQSQPSSRTVPGGCLAMVPYRKISASKIPTKIHLKTVIKYHLKVKLTQVIECVYL